MTKDDIIRMADESMYLNLPIANRNFELQELIKFAELVAAAEREACAKVCEKLGKEYNNEINKKFCIGDELQDVANDCADAIRARGQK